MTSPVTYGEAGGAHAAALTEPRGCKPGVTEGVRMQQPHGPEKGMSGDVTSTITPGLWCLAVVRTGFTTQDADRKHPRVEIKAGDEVMAKAYCGTPAGYRRGATVLHPKVKRWILNVPVEWIEVTRYCKYGEIPPLLRRRL